MRWRSVDAVLPERVRQAIDDEFGAATDQGNKAGMDARALLTEYHLSPEQWSEEAFRRMAQERDWQDSTYNHRWYIFRRLLRRLGGWLSTPPPRAPYVERPNSDRSLEGKPPVSDADDEADTASGQHGPDVVARKGDTLLVVEVKGFPSAAYVRGERAGQPKPTKPSLQAHHWFSGALTTTILRKGDYPRAQLAIALPETRTYSMLIQRAAWALEAPESFPVVGALADPTHASV